MVLDQLQEQLPESTSNLGYYQLLPNGSMDSATRGVLGVGRGEEKGMTLEQEEL